MAVWVRSTVCGVFSPTAVALCRPRVAATVLGLALLSAAGAAAIGAVRAEGRVGGASDDAALAAPALFQAHAVGAVSRPVVVTDVPGGGRELARLVPGTDVQIGGMASSRRLLVSRSSYWIRWQGGEHHYFGFVPASSIETASGSAPDIRAVAVEPSAESEAIDIEWLPGTVTAWNTMLEEYGSRHSVDPELLAIVLLVESGGNPRAGSSAGARGLMQVMPATGHDIAGERGISAFTPDQLFDPSVSIDFGAYYLAQQLRSFGRRDDPDWLESVRMAAAAYNGGPGNAQRGTWPAETQAYVKWVGGMWRERNQASSATYQEWLAAGGHRLVQSALQQLAMR